MQSNNVYPAAHPVYNQYGIQQQEKGAPQPADLEISRIKEEAQTCCCSVFTWIRVLAILGIVGVFLYTLGLFAEAQPGHKLTAYHIVAYIGYLLLSIATLVNVFCLHRWIIYQIIAGIQIFFLMMQIAGSVITVATTISLIAATNGEKSQVYVSAIATLVVGTLIGALISAFFIYIFWHAGKCQKKADAYPF